MSWALLRSWLVSGLRDLAASPLQSAIAIGSLALGLWAAILAGVITANQTSYDHFIPGSDRIYQATFQGLIDGDVRVGGGDRRVSASTPPDLAGYLRTFPEVRQVTRLSKARGIFSHGNVNLREDFYWADADALRLIKLPAVYGDPAEAMARPDGLVLTRSLARKYFGRDDARGQIVMLGHATPFMVQAVIEDLPPHDSNFQSGLFLSGLSPVSNLAKMPGRVGMGPDTFFMSVTTFVRLADSAQASELDEKATDLVRRLMKGNAVAGTLKLRFISLGAFALSPQMNPAKRERLVIFAAMAALILLLACLNFVSLTLARSGRRTVEVGIRKAAGAGRGLLVAQFLGEAVLQAVLALFAAMALVEWSLPLVNGFLQSGAIFSWWRDPLLLAGLLAAAALVGLMAGLYPAFILSGFRPAPVLKGLMLRGSLLGARMRQGLVTLQFAIPLVLIIASGVVFQQNRFAATEALRLDTSEILMISLPACGGAFDSEVLKLPGVKAVGCSGPSLLPDISMMNRIKTRDGRTVELVLGNVGFGFFELFHLTPLAGRLPARAHPGDLVQRDAAGKVLGKLHYVLNETAVTVLGYAKPQDAIGKPLKLGSLPTSPDGEIIGVVRDFSLYPQISKTRPTAYLSTQTPGSNVRAVGLDAAALHLRLNGRDIPGTLAAIDAAWKRYSPDPINRVFLTDYVQQQQIDVLRQGQAFALFAGVAVLLACLGLFGLSLSVAERRIKEIGVRKAMGAGAGQIVTLLLWQFSQPVLLANLLAWPAAWWLMRRWLAEFPYHVELHWWVFALGSVVMMMVALVTVAGQALAAARARPVLALRYE